MFNSLDLILFILVSVVLFSCIIIAAASNFFSFAFSQAFPNFDIRRPILTLLDKYILGVTLKGSVCTAGNRFFILRGWRIVSTPDKFFDFLICFVVLRL
jgi:hypothetical protein